MEEPAVVIRRATRDDVEEASSLILRFYRFNEEFDPAWVSVESIERAKELVTSSLEDPSTIVLVAEFDGRLVGLARAVVVEEPMLANSPIAVLKELYVLPEYRRRGIASRLIEEVQRSVGEMGARILAAEFPTHNSIAEEFYEKLGFRPFKSVYIRETGG